LLINPNHYSDKTHRRYSVDKNIVIVFSGRGANDAIQGLMIDYAEVLTQAGLSVIHVTFEPAEVQYVFDLMRKGQVCFAMTWLGMGQDLSAKLESSGTSVNVFEFFGVPLVKIQGDLPAYFIDRHRDIPRNTVNLYQAHEFVEFRKNWLRDAVSLTTTLPPMAMVPIDRGAIDFAARKEGTLYFLKNGNSTQALENLWSAKLPPRVATMTLRMAHELKATLLSKGPLHLGDWVARFLEASGLGSVIPPRLVWFLAAQMDDYLRRVKSTLIAEAILDFPVVVQGNFWDHVDFSGKRARLAPGTDVFASQEIVHKQLGVIDMSANVDSWPHDRVQRAAGSYSLVLTNTQGWLRDRFPEFADLTFEFDAGSIAERVADVLRHPGRYVDLAVAFGERFREIFPREAFAERVLSLVESTQLIWGQPPPQIQNFFVWSGH